MSVCRKVLSFAVLSFLVLFLLPGGACAQFVRPIGSTPANGATDVPLDTPIRVHFSFSLNNTSVSRDILFEGTTHRVVPTSILFSDDDTTITIIPKTSLKPGTYYVINLHGIASQGSLLIDPWLKNISFTTKGGHLSVITYVSPNEITMPPGGFQDVSYSFIESGGGLAEIMQDTLIYEDSGGRSISKTTEKIQIIIRNNQTTKYRASISIPQEVGNYVMGQTITVRRIFEGLDHEGNRVQYRTGVKVNILNPSMPAVSITAIEIKIPEFGAMVPVDSIIPLEARIRGEGSGDIHGSWNLDGEPKAFFVAKMTNGEAVKVCAAEKAFAQAEGKHRLAIQLIAPEKKKTEEIIYVVCSAPTPTPILLMPEEGAAFSSLTTTPPRFRWSANPSATAYRIALGKSKNFQASDWIPVDTNSWTPDFARWSAMGSGTFYWAVKPVLYNKQEGPVSEAQSFSIKN